VSDSPIPAPDAGEPVSDDLPKRSATRRTVALVIAAVVIVLAVAGGVVVNAGWGRRAMVRTAVTGVEALISGDAEQLAAVSNDTVKAQLTPPLATQMAAKAITADFGTPIWKGYSEEVTATTSMGPGVIVATPASDGSDVVIFQTMGTVSFTNGAVSLVRSWSGWVISGLSVQASKSPTATPSAPSTSSAPPAGTSPASPASPSTPATP